MKFLLLLAFIQPGGWTLQKVAVCDSQRPIEVIWGVQWHLCRPTWELVMIHHHIPMPKSCVPSHHHHCARPR